MAEQLRRARFVEQQRLAQRAEACHGDAAGSGFDVP
jgi:hypothetical protein